MNKCRTSAWLPIMIVLSLLPWVAAIIYFNGLRIDNIDKNKQVEELRAYKCAWLDFNRTHIPETALERCPEIEAIYNERK